MINKERLLALALLTLVVYTAYIDNRSVLSEKLRRQTPWIGWITFGHETNAPLFLCIYKTKQRRLHLIYIPPELKKDLSAFENVLALAMPITPPYRKITWNARPKGQGNFNDFLEAVGWLRQILSGLRFWTSGLHHFAVDQQSGVPFWDRIVFAIELSHLTNDNIRPGDLSLEGQGMALLTSLFSAENSSSETKPLTVEIFNLSDIPGLASDATKILRWKGLDVVRSANLSEDNPRTIIYDRTGNYDNALLVREALGCFSAETVTQIDPRALADVSVNLAGECR